MPVLIGIAIAALSLVSAAVFLRGLAPPKAVPEARVTLVMALTGAAGGLPRLLRALEEQTLQPRRLLIAVESTDDPAYEAVRGAAAACRLPIELIVTGLAEHSGQKCANLAAALDRLDAEDRFVAFLDADILPQAWWLSALVAPLLRPGCNIVTGYRWPTIGRNTLGAHLILALDRGIAALPRFRWTRAVWGGSVAMRREAAERLGLAAEFRRTLSDDLTIGALARRGDERVFFRRVLRVPTPLDCDLHAAWRFGHRQYQMVRLYHPRLWCFALATLSLQLAGWGAIGLQLAQSSAAQAAAALLLSMTIAKQLLLVRIGRRLGHRDPPSTVWPQLLLCAAKPLLDLCHWSMILAAARVRSVTWSHITYRVRGPRNISVSSRTPWHPSAP